MSNMCKINPLKISFKLFAIFYSTTRKNPINFISLPKNQIIPSNQTKTIKRLSQFEQKPIGDFNSIPFPLKIATLDTFYTIFRVVERQVSLSEFTVQLTIIVRIRNSGKHSSSITRKHCYSFTWHVKRANEEENALVVFFLMVIGSLDV